MFHLHKMMHLKISEWIIFRHETFLMCHSENILRNLCCIEARLRLQCSKLSKAQQPEPRFKTAKVV